MLTLLLLLIVVLGGLFFAIETGGSDWKALVPIVAAMSVATILGLKLLMSRQPEQTKLHKRRSTTSAMIVAFVLLTAIATFVFSGGGAGLKLPDFIVATSGTPDHLTLSNTNSATSVRIRKSSSGRFVTRAQLNGAPVDMIVDTGSSGILLRPSDAETAGIALAPLAYDTAVATANGTAYAASARLRTLSVGLIRLDDVDVLVARPGILNESLLGITFLRRLRSYEIGGDFLTLRN